MRIAQLEAPKGTPRWIQRLADRHSSQLESAFVGMNLLAPGGRLHWLSPRRDDHWAEYRDDSFLVQMARPDLVPKLAEFWPRRGPQWHALAAGGGRIFLIDGKSNQNEMMSNCVANPPARDLIEASLLRAKKDFGAPESADWMSGYFQQASRLAHLRFLRHYGIDAWMVFIYFTHDYDTQGGHTADSWKPHARNVAKHLGLGGKHVDNVVNVMIDARGLT
ncbi:MAG: hypothetical protein EON92_02225 [Burkholderiales bacterium]|nr:MAG: hypothetical protein EON92_02225 [Burkholderiales bacterium]